MVKRVAWRPAYRIIDSRYPFVGIYDRIVDPADLEAVIAIEALTNERILDEAGVLALVRPGDRIGGAGTTPVMAAFTHTRPSRFSDGTFGVYYAARARRTAIAEARYHKTQFLAATHEPSIDLDMRLYAADVAGAFEDVRARAATDPLYALTSYGASQRFARERYDADRVDGIVYRSVRDSGREADCVAVFRPRNVTNCVTAAYLAFRWDGRSITDVYVKDEMIRFEDEG
ncbi:MAG: RES family NAD+ phosphorylase [Candidatus Elarobacter sp.]